MASLGLNEHHQSAVVNFMRFARYQRGLRIKSVIGAFEDLKSSRLTEDTFTLDEVDDMLNGLLAVVRGEVDSELIHTSHTSVLLLIQLCQQAEKWHLKLQAEISELENRELLEQVRDFEDREFSGAPGRDMDFKARLQPLNESGGAALLQMEIERMKEENDKLQDRLKQVEGQTLNIQKEKSRLQAELDRAQKEILLLKSREPDMSSADLENLRQQMAGLKATYDKTSSQNQAQSTALEGELVGAKHELLKVQEMLELAEKELEKKVSLTVPFKNLKAMLQKKNDQLKDLRKRLSKYEEVSD